MIRFAQPFQCCRKIRLPVLCCVLLSACATPPPPVVVQKEHTPLDYFANLQTRSPEQRRVEWTRLEQEGMPATSLIDAVHYGLARSLDAACDASCETQVLAYLDAAAADTSAAKSYRNFAEWLRLYLHQRQQLRSAQQAADAASADKARLENVNQQLQTQIKALTQLEQEMAERELGQE